MNKAHIKTGLYYYGARYYDPRTSVFVSTDPILESYMSGKPNGGVFNPQNLSLFSYTMNNPIRYIDSNGEFSFEFYIAMEYDRDIKDGAAAAYFSFDSDNISGTTLETTTKWVTRGVTSKDGSETAIKAGTYDYSYALKGGIGEPLPLLMGSKDGKAGGEIPALGPNPWHDDREVADEIFLHPMGNSAGCNGPTCTQDINMNGNGKGKDANDKATYMLFSPAEAIEDFATSQIDAATNVINDIKGWFNDDE